MTEELVEIVDDAGNVIATVTRAEMRARRLRHRSVGIAVMSTDGRLLVHRRSPHKDVWPGYWDIAAGGVVAAGETFEVAARRELAEELGLVVAELEYLGEGQYSDGDVAEVARCYRVVHDGPFTFDDGEVVEARWVSLTELAAMRTDHDFVPDSIALLLPLLTGR
jgi:8-oxo-dGTP pyrophosphatase MutT (NUDIX family)